MRNTFEEALHFRHACKLFDTHQKIDSEELRFVLDAARLSPSSFGMEPWKFLIIQDGELKTRLGPLCWDQPQITSCSDLVVLLFQKNLRSTNPHVAKQFAPKGELFERYMKVYAEFVDPRSDEELSCWAGKQVYLASGFLMMAAASIGIDSCPIEGFEKEKVEALLEIDTENYGIAYLVALGYRAKEQQPRSRRAFGETVEFR